MTEAMWFRRHEQLDVAIAAVCIVLSTAGPSLFLARHVWDGILTFESWPLSGAFALVGIAGVALLLRDRPRVPRGPARVAVAAIAVYLAWSMASATWSVEQGLSLRRAITTTGVVLFGIWFALALRARQQVLAVGAATAVVVVWSAVLVLGWPLWGGGYWDARPIAERYEEFRGIFVNANSLGPIAALGGLWFTAAMFAARRWSACAGAFVLLELSLWLLNGSGSDTSIAAFGACCALAAALYVVERARAAGVAGPRVGVTALVVVAAGTVLVLARPEWFSDVAGGDATFGFRTEIWHDVWGAITQRPWRGYGFWAFWDNPEVTALVQENNGSAHNSALEVALGLGVVGVVPFATVLVLAITGTVRWVWRVGGLVPSLWALLVFLLLLENVTESFVLWHSYNWMLLCASAVLPWVHLSCKVDSVGNMHEPHESSIPPGPDEADARRVSLASRL